MLEKDVVIVGGSVSGLTTAMYLDRRDILCTVYDERSQIGEPVICAEGVIDKVLKDHKIPETGNHIATKITRVVMKSPKGRVIELELDRRCGYILNRDKFEQLLANRAKRDNLDIVSGAKVLSVKRADGYYKVKYRMPVLDKVMDVETTCRVVVIASGMRTPIAKQCGWNINYKREDVGACYQYTLEFDEEIPSNEIYIHWGSKYTPGGYFWVFPKGKHIANVGLGVISQDINLPKNLDSLIKEHFSGYHYRRLRTIGGVVPLAPPVKPCYRDNALLVGDAGNYTFALTGGGIGTGMLSGKYAGETIKGYLDCENEISDYELRMQGLIKKLTNSYNLKTKMIHSNRVVEWYFTLAKIILFINKIAPNFVQENAFKNLRY